MSDNKRRDRSVNGKGYYIALILCAAAIGISGYLYQKNSPEAEEVVLRETEPLIVVMDPAPEDVPVIAPRETEPMITLPEALRETAPQQAEKKSLTVMSPVVGVEIMPYSVEALSYNETTRDWRVHDGVDLAADEGTEVFAAADGRVYTTFEDDNLGTTVVIVHDGGYTTRYASLREDILVKPGDQVCMGDTLGYVGTTALVESVMGPHVHFSVSYRDTPMDPADFLKLS